MSKKKALKQKKQKASKPSQPAQRNVVVVISLLLCLVFAGSILAQWRSMHVANRMNAMLAPTPTVPGPGSPSKEYIYAGGRLLATEEPATSSQNTTSGRINVALATNGGVATASSDYGTGYSPANAINGDKKGLNWGNGGGWVDGTPYNYDDDWLQVTFQNNKIIDEIDVFTVQDNYTSPVPPDDTTTFSIYGLTGFDVQYWTGTSWVTVPGGNITGNNKIWTKISFTPIPTDKIRVRGLASPTYYSRITELEAYGTEAAPSSFNVARATQGSTASASSEFSTAYPASTVINGDRKGTDNGVDGLWVDGTTNEFPDTLEVDFHANRTISEIDVITIQDNFWAPEVPTDTMTFSYYGLTSFEVQYMVGSSWVTVPNGNITGNNKVWRKITFPELSTQKIRVVCNGSVDGRSRVVEIEAWGH